MWTYNLQIIWWYTVIALAIIAYIVELNLYELHPMNEQMFNDFIDDKQLHLAKCIFTIFFTRSFGCVHMIGAYAIYLFITCVCV